jgi:hypothetical protein
MSLDSLGSCANSSGFFLGQMFLSNGDVLMKIVLLYLINSRSWANFTFFDGIRVSDTICYLLK